MLLPNHHSININPIPKPPPLLPNLNIVPTHLPLPHPPILSKSPILKPVASLPLHSIVGILILVPELHGNLVVRESEEFLAQAVGFFFLPFRCEEGDDGVCTLEEVGAVAPDGVGGVGFGDGGGISLKFQMMSRVNTR